MRQLRIFPTNSKQSLRSTWIIRALLFTNLVFMAEISYGQKSSGKPKQPKAQNQALGTPAKKPDGVYQANIDFGSFALTTYQKMGDAVIGTLFNGLRNICYQGTLDGTTIKNSHLVLLERDYTTRPPSQRATDLLAEYPVGHLETAPHLVSLEFNVALQVCLEYFNRKPTPEPPTPDEDSICGDKSIITEFDSADPDYHEYGADGKLRTLMCTKISSTCNPRLVFTVMLEESRFNTITDDRRPLVDCKSTNVQIGPYSNNQIRSVVDDIKLTVTHYTVAGKHKLHPGKVVRRVLADDGRVYVQTEGEGTGDYGTANEWFSSIVWSGVDERLQYRLAFPDLYRQYNGLPLTKK